MGTSIEFTDKQQRVRGNGAASGRRCARTGYPALARWANFCRAYGAWIGARDESKASHPSGSEGWGTRRGLPPDVQTDKRKRASEAAREEGRRGWMVGAS